MIVDDEPGNIITLVELLKGYCPDVMVSGTAENIRSAEEMIRNEKPDLVFLDIEMPYGNGFDLLEKIRPVDFEVIFVTAFDNYAVKAFRYAAIDYILKPVNIVELQGAVDKVVKRFAEKSINNKVELLLSSLKNNQPELKRIALPTQEGLQFESYADILYLEANANYTFVHIKNGQKYLVSKTLGDFEGILPAADFCRIHNSFIININYIRQYYKGRGGYVVMENGTNIEVSVRKKESFLSKFKYEE